MNELEISHQELSRLANDATQLATRYWETLEHRQSYPSTSGTQTTELFTRTWPEEGRGREVLQDFMLIAEHSRPSTGRFFGYVFGSGEPVAALAEWLAASRSRVVFMFTPGQAAPAGFVGNETPVPGSRTITGRPDTHDRNC